MTLEFEPQKNPFSTEHEARGACVRRKTKNNRANIFSRHLIFMINNGFSGLATNFQKHIRIQYVVYTYTYIFL